MNEYFLKIKEKKARGLRKPPGKRAEKGRPGTESGRMTLSGDSVAEEKPTKEMEKKGAERSLETQKTLREVKRGEQFKGMANSSQSQ